MNQDNNTFTSFISRYSITCSIFAMASKLSSADVEVVHDDEFKGHAHHAEASAATAREHQLSFRDSLRLYPKAIGFSLLFSTAIIMEGYDLALIGSFYGYQPFRNKYGNESDGEGGKVISAEWQTYIQVGGMCGQIIGLYLNGWVSDAIGYKRSMILSQMLMIALIFIVFFAKNIEMILAGQILLGIPWGVFQTLTLAYASDVAPVVLRPYLTAYVNLCWVIGQLISAGVLRGFLNMDNEWSYRIPFAIQWVWPPFIILGTLFAPESPWWLVRQGRHADAKQAVLKLVSPKPDLEFDADAQVAMIHATNELEKATSAGTNYWHCFMRTDLRRTEIASITYIAQATCGSVLMGYSVQFYERAGLDPNSSFTLNIVQYAVGAVGVILSWFLMAKLGRRTLYIGGTCVLFIILIVVGGLGFADSSKPGPSWAVGSLLIFYTFIYDMAVGPVCYTIVAEIPSTRLKAKTIVLARNFNNMAGLVNNTLMPRMLGVNSWNWGAKTGLFWAAFCLLIMIWAYFRLPEPKDRTYGELDVLFEHKVSARKFATTRVDQFGDDKGAVEVDAHAK
ncbi:MFS domain-containing protein [Fusarium keratoplasticum]|uniref:MFS domain-containing protein n=1 Tax=Fusarium keratoplasticum TaxID=1328300 RepID=A0ACC0QFU3_9HYPO|nr:MFS domain-containing protein [Fusarium keratoplasticum]KAI8650734.1 MFS domain-containing protein [Fusarium keratoplasticum]